MSLTLDLFAEVEGSNLRQPESAPVIGVDLAVSKGRGVVTAHIPGFETMAPETQQALGEMVHAVWSAADRGELPTVKSSPIYSTRVFNPHAYAFVAQARKHGHTDPSLPPAQVSAAGRREFDIEELARFANELLRGVRSTRPTMTPERWGEAIAKVREAS